jgi:glycosyltransferase involved in cell wall biosynthesis
MPAKITIDLSFVDEQPTGVGTYALGLTTALRELGSPADALLAWNGVRSLPLGDYLDARDSGPVLSSGISRRGLAQLRQIPIAHAAARWVRAQLAPRFEFFHALNFIPTFRIAGEVIPTVHDLSFLRYPELNRTRRGEALTRAAELFRTARAVHTISHFTKGEIQELLGISPHRIFVVPPAATDAPGDMSALPDGLQHDKFILYVGSSEPRKNLGVLLKAYLALENDLRAAFPLVLAGPIGRIDTGIAPAAEALARGEIRLPGYLPVSTIRSMMRAARVFAFPSVYEGFGMPVLEALGEGTPVIVSERAGLDESSCGLGTLVPAGDVDAWRQALASALSVVPAAEQRTSLRIAARSRFSWERSALETLRMYAALPDL